MVKIEQSMKDNVSTFLQSLFPSFKPDCWGITELEGSKDDDIKYLDVAGYDKEQRKCFNVTLNGTWKGFYRIICVYECKKIYDDKGY